VWTYFEKIILSSHIPAIRLTPTLSSHSQARGADTALDEGGERERRKGQREGREGEERRKGESVLFIGTPRGRARGPQVPINTNLLF